MTSTTAKYIRLSSEDVDLKYSDKEESDSITNQRNLLDAFISRTPELAGSNIIEFCDDGWSGKNFERPAVQEMIAQVRAGKIQCIIVKDLSRFGRDYITVGNYISCVFPFLGVRFIAVNDGFDSIRPNDIDSLETSFKTILYDLYSRDLSRKVRSAKRFRAQRGDFLAPFAPYGYRKDPEKKNHLIIDPDAAETVRRIFRMAAEGYTREQIAAQLNREAVPTPMRYKRAAGCTRSSWPCIHEDNFWTARGISKLLLNEQYIGKEINGQLMRDTVGRSHMVYVNRQDWIIVENAHESIVTQEEFDRAQTVMQSHTEGSRCRKIHHLLSGKVRCGICGYAMRREKGRQHFYCCQTSRVTDAYPCTGERIAETDILEVVSSGLRVQAQIAVEFSRLWEEQRRGQKKDTATMKKKLRVLRDTHQQYSQQIISLYESFALGEINKTAYLAAKAVLIEQKDAVAVEISELEAVLENVGTDGKLQNDFVSTFEKYAAIDEINKDIIDDVLKEILVYPDGRLEIIWNYCDEYKKMMLDLGLEQQGV